MNKTNKNTPTRNKQQALTVKEAMPLMVFLSKHFEGKSRNSLKSILAHKQICINGKAVSQFDFPLSVGDKLTINRGKVSYELKHPKVKIVYEDDYLIVIDKADGLPAVASDDKKNETTAFLILSNYLKRKDPRNRLFVVHRLDREISGLLIYAKNREVQLALQNNWHKNVRERLYWAIVEGVPALQEDCIASYQKQSKAFKIHSLQTGDGQEAMTRYRIVRSNENYAMLRLELDTGKKNEIRAHMQEIGHPVIGDRKYGASSSPIGRVGLHARVLAFTHPVTQEKLRFQTPIPTKFNALFAKQKNQDYD